MAEWKINGSDQSTLGLKVVSVKRGAPWSDEAILEAGDDFLAADSLAYGAAVTIHHPDGTKVFAGKVRGLPREAGGDEESRRYRVAGPWRELEDTIYMQLFQGAVEDEEAEEGFILEEYWCSQLWLGIVNGAAVNTKQQIAAVLAYAGSTAGISIGSGTMGFTGVPIQPAQTQDQNCARVIQSMLRFHPDCLPWIDYSVTPPTLNVAALGGLDQTTVGLTDVVFESLNVEPRPDLKPVGVVLKWRRVGLLGRIEVHEDRFPSGITETLPGVRIHTMWLDAQANSTAQETVDVVTRPLPADGASDQTNLRKWWKHQIPWLKRLIEKEGLDISNVKFHGHKLEVVPPPEDLDSDPDGETAVTWSTEPTDYPRELVQGEAPEWLQKSKVVAPVRATVELELTATPANKAQKKVFGEDGKRRIPITVQVKGTNLSRGRYTGVPSGGAEPPAFPADGLAELLYNQVTEVRYQGSGTLVGDDCPLDILPGMRLGITGGVEAWEDMAAPVWEVSFNPDMGSTAVRFGPLGSFTIDDLQEQQRLWRLYGATGANVEEQTEAKGGGGAGRGHEVLAKAQRADLVNAAPPPPEQPHHAFAIVAHMDGETLKAFIHPGKLYWQATKLKPFEETPTAPVNKLNAFTPIYNSGELVKAEEIEEGEYWLKWTTTVDGDVDSCELVNGDPGAETEFDPNNGVTGVYKLKVGKVEADATVTQYLRGDAVWKGTSTKTIGNGSGGSSGEDEFTELEVMLFISSLTNTCECSCSCDCGSGTGTGDPGSGGGTDPGTGGGGSCSCSVTTSATYYVQKIKLPKAWVIGAQDMRTFPVV